MTVEQARREFPHTWTDMVYLNHAAISPMTFRVRDAVDRYLTRRALKGIEPYPWAQKMALETKIMLAQMLHCRADQIAFVLNTSDGLNVLAEGLELQSGDRVLINDLEFPANVYPFLNLKRRGVEVDIIKKNPLLSKEGTGIIKNNPLLFKEGAGGGYSITPDDIAKHLTPQTKLVSISHVQFATGAKANLTAIGKLCRERNILFAVDAIQALPHCAIDAEQSCIDFLATGSHKWLMAPEGTGFIFVGDRALKRIRQSYLGWRSVDDSFNFDNLDPARLVKNAERFENGTLNFIGIAGLNASMQFFLEFGLPAIERNVLDLSGYLIDRLEMHGVEVITPKAEEERAGIVAFNFPDAEKTYERLYREQIIISLRSGRLRAAPHFYNTEEEVKKLVAGLFQ
ncbi:MAG TPA: aminotransferase class V-fold PLP-dependent enzyme [Candidatus Kapabacteria bacterium]|jgi:selenocysteine lyase/cysteine desulfurase|nr:aminotransferase class V-fold PLP-dependent enzyme [Candidatus Kapabacteria bacterium]